jgi:hypothetical protein
MNSSLQEHKSILTAKDALDALWAVSEVKITYYPHHLISTPLYIFPPKAHKSIEGIIGWEKLGISIKYQAPPLF